MNPFPSSSGATTAPLAAPVPPVRRDPALSIPAKIHPALLMESDALVVILAKIAARRIAEAATRG